MKGHNTKIKRLAIKCLKQGCTNMRYKKGMNKIKKIYEAGKIRAPIHLSRGNEKQLIKIFKRIKKDDWVISNWRSHYHALLHGVPEKTILDEIIRGKSMSLNFNKYKFIASSIVAGGIPIGLGVALAIKRRKLKNKVLGCWCSPEKCHGDILIKILNEIEE